MGLKKIAILLVALQVTVSFARDFSYESSYEETALADDSESVEDSSEMALASMYDPSSGETVEEWWKRINDEAAPASYPESFKQKAYAIQKAQQLPKPSKSDLKRINKKLNDQELKRTNELRALHGAKPLEYDPKIAVYAQKYVDQITSQMAEGYPFQHNPDAQKRGLGENMAGDAADPPNGNGGSTDMWYFGEIGQYKKNGEKPSDVTGAPIATGHFTQVVWDKTERMGCGRACQSTSDCVVLCNYYPGGNMQGFSDDETVQNYRKNVNMKMNKNAQMKFKKYKSQISELTKNSIEAMGAE